MDTSALGVILIYIGGAMGGWAITDAYYKWKYGALIAFAEVHG